MIFSGYHVSSLALSYFGRVLPFALDCWMVLGNCCYAVLLLAAFACFALAYYVFGS